MVFFTKQIKRVLKLNDLEKLRAKKLAVLFFFIAFFALGFLLIFIGDYYSVSKESINQTQVVGIVLIIFGSVIGWKYPEKPKQSPAQRRCLRSP